jgi:phosphoglucosamine mutase
VSGPLLSKPSSRPLSAGVDALVGRPADPGPLSPPALGAVGGAVLSASWPVRTAGKLFSGEGGKLPDAGRADRGATRPTRTDGPPAPGSGVAVRRARHPYLDGLRSLPAGFDLTGVARADCAHGATYRVAPRLSVARGGRGTSERDRAGRTSAAAGALHPTLQASVRHARGGGSRVRRRRRRLIVVDSQAPSGRGSRARSVPGRSARAALRGSVVVSTMMANLRLERALVALGVGWPGPVGDRYVLEEMRRLGGEPRESSQAVVSFSTTRGPETESDGSSCFGRCARQGSTLGAGGQVEVPQVLLNVRVRPGRPRRASWGGGGPGALGGKLDGRARLLLRYSGTEPLAQVMVGRRPTTIDAAPRDPPPLTRRSERHRDPTTQLGVAGI